MNLRLQPKDIYVNKNKEFVLILKNDVTINSVFPITGVNFKTGKTISFKANGSWTYQDRSDNKEDLYNFVCVSDDSLKIGISKQAIEEKLSNFARNEKTSEEYYRAVRNNK
jgi:hypothetical protein